MLIDIKEKLNKLRGQKIKIQVDVGRNKNEIFEGIVLDIYKNVWTFKTKTDVKSFGYNDIFIKNVIIDSPFW